jgi:hypothetical protein
MEGCNTTCAIHLPQLAGPSKQTTASGTWMNRHATPFQPWACHCTWASRHLLSLADGRSVFFPTLEQSMQHHRARPPTAALRAHLAQKWAASPPPAAPRCSAPGASLDGARCPAARSQQRSHRHEQHGTAAALQAQSGPRLADAATATRQLHRAGDHRHHLACISTAQHRHLPPPLLPASDLRSPSRRRPSSPSS